MTRWWVGVCSAAVMLRAAAAEPPAPAVQSGTPVKEIEIDARAREPACRRYAPTGSRIAKRRCDVPALTNEARDSEREQLRRDVEEMRMRQLMREQARALADAARRRPGP